MDHQSIVYGDDKIDFQVCYLPERTKKKVAIHVHPDGSVQVDAPQEAENGEVREAVRKRARWVLKHVSEAKRQREHVIPRQYVSGESYFYLGRRHVLQVSIEPDSRGSVKLVRGRLVVSTHKESAGTIKDLLRRWYRHRAKEYLQRRLDAHTAQVSWVSGSPPWKMVSMEKQWGNCSPKGLLSFNYHLVKAPRDCINYVIIHELCHLKEHNHSERFYRLMDQKMPNWRPVKARLDGMAELLLNE